MNSEQFKKLTPDSEVHMDGKTYTVIQTDHRGNIQLQLLQFYIDVWDYRDDFFDDEEAANDHLSELIEDTKEEITDLADFISDLDDDDEQKEESQEELDKLEERLDNLNYADIESEEHGELFWIHYKDINEDDI